MPPSRWVIATCTTGFSWREASILTKKMSTPVYASIHVGHLIAFLSDVDDSSRQQQQQVMLEVKRKPSKT